MVYVTDRICMPIELYIDHLIPYCKGMIKRQWDKLSPDSSVTISSIYSLVNEHKETKFCSHSILIINFSDYSAKKNNKKYRGGSCSSVSAWL